VRRRQRVGILLAGRRLGGPLARARAAARDDLRSTFGALARPGPLRRVLLAEGQSAFGDAAAYVALLVVAYQRLHSPWALAAVLLADVAPRLLVAPPAGALADRFQPRTLMITADALRAAALVGLVAIPSFFATVLLAGVLGSGTALYRPAAEASMPMLTEDPELAARAVTTRYTLITLGQLLGWITAGLLFLVARPVQVLYVDALTFAISIALIATTRIRRGAGAPHAGGGQGIVSMVLEGGRAARGTPGVLALLLTASCAALTAGMINVAEPLIAKNVLHAGNTGFTALVAAFGIGLVLGSAFSGPRERSVVSLRFGYSRAQAIGACGFAIVALAPSLLVALLGSLVGGIGDGLELTRARQLVQLTVAKGLLGRITGLFNASEPAAIMVAFVIGGIVSSLLGARATFAIAGAGLLVTAAGGALWWARHPE